MAKVIRQSILNTVFRQQLNLAAVFLFVVLAALLLPFYYWRLLDWRIWLLLEGAALLVLYLLYRRITITAAGARGELQTFLFLRRGLGRNFWLLPDRVLQYGEHRSQVDYLILAPAALVLIECKNVSGRIEGNGTDRYLRQRKYRDGTVYEEKQLYNPLLQVAGHRRTLQNLCKRAGVGLPIYTVVYFCNRNAQVEIHGGGQHIYTLERRDQLLHFLERLDGQEVPVGWRKSFVSILNKN